MELPTTPATILVVDDAPSNLAVLTEALRNEYEVRIASSGSQALRLVEDNPPDLILLDILMPEMDGYEVCRRFKARAATRNIPIIFLTAKGDVADETLGLALGAAQHTRREADFGEQLQRFHTVVGGNQILADGQRAPHGFAGPA